MGKRNLGLDVLRILSMIMIVALHVLGKGKFLSETENIVFYQISYILEILSIVAVNCYVLISGYFLVNSEFKWKKLLKIWREVFFYSTTIYIMLIITGIRDFSVTECIKSVLPVVTKQYWFVNSYLLLYILSPFFNKLIKAMDKKEFEKLLIIMLIAFCILPSILPGEFNFDNTGGYGIIWFVVLYFVSAYIKLHINLNYKNRINLWIYFAISSIGLIGTLLLKNTSQKLGIQDISMRFYNYNFILVFISSVFLFLYFTRLKIKSNRIENVVTKIAPLTFSVYLIHEQNVLRQILYLDILHLDQWWNSILQIFIIPIVILSIFIICCIIESIRKLILKKVKSI